MLTGLLLAAATMSTSALDAGSAPLDCRLQAPARVTAGQPVSLRFTLTNRGRDVEHVLVWGTPFEGWFAPFVAMRRDGVDLPYRGPMVKRGDPERDEYLAIVPGQSLSASVELEDVFDLRQPGHYRVEPRIVLHDVVAGADPTLPRSRAQFVAAPLACNAVGFELRPAQP